MKVRSILNPLVVLLSFGMMASCTGQKERRKTFAEKKQGLQAAVTSRGR